jgi:hypothetical protein
MPACNKNIIDIGYSSGNLDNPSRAAAMAAEKRNRLFDVPEALPNFTALPFPVRPFALYNPVVAHVFTVHGTST